MIIILKKDITSAEKEKIRSILKERGFIIKEIKGEQDTILGAVGMAHMDPREVEILPGVASVVPISKPYKLASRELKNKAVAVGIDWSGELFQVLTQHIRFGLAHVSTEGTVSYGNGTTASVNQGNTKPYVGLGLSYQFNEHVRFYQSYDYLQNKGGEHFHVFSMGLGIEN